MLQLATATTAQFFVCTTTDSQSFTWQNGVLDDAPFHAFPANSNLDFWNDSCDHDAFGRIVACVQTFRNFATSASCGSSTLRTVLLWTIASRGLVFCGFCLSCCLNGLFHAIFGGSKA